MILFATVGSPLGRLLLTSDGEWLTGLYMEGHRHGPEISDGWVQDGSAAPLAACAEQLRDYFAGERVRFALPLRPEGTGFQRRVWEALSSIPFGATVSYGGLAERMGSSGASRAVGLANGRNPISIIIPCHRVVGADGSLTGYGGGIERKRALLAFEAAVARGAPGDDAERLAAIWAGGHGGLFG